MIVHTRVKSPEKMSNRNNVATIPTANGGKRAYAVQVDGSNMHVRATGIDELKAFFGRRLKGIRVIDNPSSNIPNLSALF